MINGCRGSRGAWKTEKCVEGKLACSELICENCLLSDESRNDNVCPKKRSKQAHSSSLYTGNQFTIFETNDDNDGVHNNNNNQIKTFKIN